MSPVRGAWVESATIAHAQNAVANAAEVWLPCDKSRMQSLSLGPSGTEFLDAETGHQKPPLKCTNARRDQKPGIEWRKIPAETPYLASCRKRAVCGDWVVETVDIELAAHHPVSLEPGVSNAATERQNRPIWPMFAGRDHANQRLWRACCSQARLGLIRVVVENHSSGYPAVRICRRQCSPSDTSRSLFPQEMVPSRNSSLIVKTLSA